MTAERFIDFSLVGQGVVMSKKRKTQAEREAEALRKTDALFEPLRQAAKDSGVGLEKFLTSKPKKKKR